MDMQNDIYIDANNSVTKSACYHVVGHQLNDVRSGVLLTDKLASAIQPAEQSISMEIQDSLILLSSHKKQRSLTEAEDRAMENAFLHSVERIAKGRLITS